DASTVTLDPTPGTYQATCDGSVGVYIDADHFLDGNDENQGLRIYKRGATATPVQTFDASEAAGLDTGDEADLEDAARIGDRVYVIGSHGRNKDGELSPARYRFFGLDLSGSVPSVAFAPAGSTDKLLEQMLVAGNWTTPNTTIISLL